MSVPARNFQGFDGGATRVPRVLVALLTWVRGDRPPLSAPTVPLVPTIVLAQGRSGDSGPSSPHGPMRRGSTGSAKPRTDASSNAPMPSPKTPSPLQAMTAVGGSVLAVLALVGATLLFAGNANVVRADAADKQGQMYEQIGSQCLSQPQACPIEGVQQLTTQQVIVYTGTSILPQAVAYYQQALDKQPSQDRYDLDMGRAYLDEARYYLVAAGNPTVARQANITTAAARRSAAQEFATAVVVLQRARTLNPYNADHPLNLARLYTSWATQLDPSKWPLADAYYRIALGPTMAVHNGRAFDEWGRAALAQAQQPTLTQARRTVLYRQALAAFGQACAVDDLLGDARALRGDAYAALGRFPQAAASYAEALRVGGFEAAQTQATVGTVVQGLIMALSNARDDRGLVSPLYGGGATALYGGASPMMLATSPTVAADFSPAFTSTLRRITTTLRQRGLLK